MRIHFLVNRRAVPEPSPVLLETYDRLRSMGAEVDEAIPEEGLASLAELRPERDLYVLKSHTELALSVASVLDSAGARVLNPYRSCVLTQDKITCTALLARAAVPVPPSWAVGEQRLLAELLGHGPLIAKPHRGHWGRGIHILRSRDDVEELPAERGPYLVQRYLQADREELKVYVVGRRAFGVTKPFSPTSFQDTGRAVDLDRHTREIALSCGAALGLHLYGVDLVQTDSGPFVVDVNYFPGYKGVTDAAEMLAEYIFQFAAGPG